MEQQHTGPVEPLLTTEQDFTRRVAQLSKEVKALEAEVKDLRDRLARQHTEAVKTEKILTAHAKMAEIQVASRQQSFEELGNYVYQLIRTGHAPGDGGTSK